MSLKNNLSVNGLILEKVNFNSRQKCGWKQRFPICAIWKCPICDAICLIGRTLILWWKDVANVKLTVSWLLLSYQAFNMYYSKFREIKLYKNTSRLHFCLLSFLCHILIQSWKIDKIFLQLQYTLQVWGTGLFKHPIEIHSSYWV